MRHDLKIWPQYYKAVADGSKTFEVRTNDRDFKTGDVVELREWDNKLRPLSGQPVGYTDSIVLAFKIGYVLPIDKERVVFSLLPIAPTQTNHKDNPESFDREGQSSGV